MSIFFKVLDLRNLLYISAFSVRGISTGIKEADKGFSMD
jgi:hypothetical protein